jgi:hypothetical protein
MHTILYSENLKRRDHFRDIGIDDQGNIKMDVQEIGVEDFN